jgi:hypothetical protein
MTAHKRWELRVTTLRSRDQLYCTEQAHGGRKMKGKDRMVVVGGREVFDTLQNGGTEVLGAYTC